MNISGGVLVGLVMGSISGTADPRAVRIPLGAFGKPTPVCVTSKTRDGQYWSQATLTAPASNGGVGIMQPQPPWRFIGELSVYSRRDYAVLARYGPDCDIDPAAPYLPVMYGGQPAELTAAINAQRAISSRAHLVFASKVVVPGRCEQAPPDVRATAFNLVCRFDLASKPADAAWAELILNRRERTGDRSDTFRVRLPP